ncbi:MAG TPA: hypothetical protein VLY85_01545 [Thermoplasmata archaeon]|nr:hypothetical protein [Thermoplasmata archaeon]
MSATNVDPLEARVAVLEKKVKELRAHLQAVEQLVAAAPDHPEDRTLIRQKVTFDWQA